MRRKGVKAQSALVEVEFLPLRLRREDVISLRTALQADRKLQLFVVDIYTARTEQRFGFTSLQSRVVVTHKVIIPRSAVVIAHRNITTGIVVITDGAVIVARLCVVITDRRTVVVIGQRVVIVRIGRRLATQRGQDEEDEHKMP